VQLGLLLAGSEMVSFTLFGWLLDYAFGTMPGFTIIFTLFGVAAAFFQLIQMSKVMAKKKSTQDPEDLQ
jgi:F0F1-type ATP synthase assembly protein I